MLSQEAIQKILGIDEKVHITPEKMADELNVTFFPYNEKTVSSEVLQFLNQLKKTFLELKVNVVPYNEALVKIPKSKIFRRVYLLLLNNLLFFFERILLKKSYRNFVEFAAIKRLLLRPVRIKSGISIIAVADSKATELPIDYTSSFRNSSVVTLLDMPANITEKSTFHEHFDTAMKLFAEHMTNIVIGINKKEWILYNFNASHPVYPLKENFRENILKALISKIVAPIRPYRFSDFIVKSSNFNITDEPYRSLINDFVLSGALLDKAGLYPKGKKIDDLPFRNQFYKLIGKIHLDNRSGMSYGFLSLQMPISLPVLISYEKSSHRRDFQLAKKDYVVKEDGAIFVALELPQGKYILEIPKVFVLSQKSGSDKTNFNAKKDLIKIGLINGRMTLETPKGLVLTSDFKPSFDTKVILAHAVGNAIVGAVISHFRNDSKFVKLLTEQGMALVHWHGYVGPQFIPKNIYVHGANNPHVSCSSPQSAIYAIDGKLKMFQQAWISNETDYLGDMHIEPHHGTNMTFPSLQEFSRFVSSHSEIAALGNRYLDLYL